MVLNPVLEKVEENKEEPEKNVVEAKKVEDPKPTEAQKSETEKEKPVEEETEENMNLSVDGILMEKFSKAEFDIFEAVRDKK